MVQGIRSPSMMPRPCVIMSAGAHRRAAVDADRRSQSAMCACQSGVDMADQPFVTDMQTLRARVRQHIEHGAVTAGYRADRDTVIRLFNEAVATELVCVLRSKRHCFLASGIKAPSVAQGCLPHATDAQAPAD